MSRRYVMRNSTASGALPVVRVACVAVGLLLVACQPSYPFGPPLDAGTDAGRDAGSDAGADGGDAGPDAGPDAGTSPQDGGPVDAGWCPATDCVCNGYELCNWTDDTFQCAVDDLWTHTVVPPDVPPASQYQLFCPGAVSKWRTSVDCLVTDLVTGLVWQRTPSTDAYTAAEAVIHCAGLDYGGFSSGWRVPTVVELASIVDFNVGIPAINGTAFPRTPATQFWTSTPYPPNETWFIDFVTGAAVYVTLVPPRFPVRCVR